jgi:hypothetical protein
VHAGGPRGNRPTRTSVKVAQALHHAENEIGEHYRRFRGRLGGAAAVTAMAHKLARILYVMLKTRQPYRPDLHDAAGGGCSARGAPPLCGGVIATGVACRTDSPLAGFARRPSI